MGTVKGYGTKTNTAKKMMKPLKIKKKIQNTINNRKLVWWNNNRYG